MKLPLSRITLSLATMGVASALSANPVDFNRQIKPILESQCVSCHQPGEDKGGLMLDTLQGMIKGGDSGTSLVPGQPDRSAILARVMLPHDDDDIMPPKGDPLTAEQQALLKTWIAEGANWPQGLVLKARTKEELKAIARLEQKVNRIRSVEILPPDFNLETKRDKHRVMVFATFDDDTTRDVTEFAEIKVANAGTAKLEAGVLYPVQDGATEVQVAFHGKTATAPVKVVGATTDRPVSFKLDVMPIFMAAGCNTGGCHGSARGKDGFMLSLFGYDPDGDYKRITRELAGRRVNLAIPEESTLVEKSLGTVPHSGNECFAPGSEFHKTMVEWIANGVPEDSKDVATVTGIEIFPKACVMEGQAENQQVTVRATFSDGTDRDVTNEVVFSSNNDPCATVSKQGVVTSHERGEAFILARYSTYSVVSQFIIIPENLKYERPKLVENNYIDTLVNDKLHKLRILPSEICSDQEFVRRIYIDVVGLLPSPEEVKSFVADANPKKREALIDQLLNRKEFTEMWVMKWSELLQMHSVNNANEGTFYKNVLLYYGWLQDRLANNVPLNEMVAELLSAQGSTIANPPTNYYQTERDTLLVTENVAQVFMGMRIQCAQCHNHPFDRWTMDDYYGFMAFFTQIGRKTTDDPREQIVFNRGNGNAVHPVTKAAVMPKFLGGEQPEIAKDQDRRAVMAKWLASDENPFFARNLSNITWSHFFGVGIIDPVDDVRVSNPASNPELLSALAGKLSEYKYDFKRLVRDICNSMTYQRSTKANESNESDKFNFAKAKVRRLRAEVLADALSSVTNVPMKYQGLPLGARAVQIADGSVSDYFLTTFGRAQRTTVCSCEVKMDPALGQALHFINGNAVHENIKKGKVVADMIAKDKKSDDEIIQELFLRSLGREARPEEKAAIIKQIQEAPEERQGVLEDVFWALLNSKEFYFNH
jgi:mono/diheme cytochrome c family protein